LPSIPPSFPADRRGIFPTRLNFFIGETDMLYQNKKFIFEIDELTNMKLNSLIGKGNFKNNDFTKLVRIMIDSSYANSKGKKAKGM